MAEESKNIVKVERGDFVFRKGQKIGEIALLVKGSVMVIDEYMQVPLQVGDVIGLMDMDSDKYLFDYVAIDTSMICKFEISSIDDYEIVGTAIKDYRNHVIRSICNQMDNILNVYETLDGLSRKLYQNIKDYYGKYKKLCSNYNKNAAISADIESVQMFNDSDRINEKSVGYLQSLSKKPASIVKPFFGEDDDVTGYHLFMAAELARKAAYACMVRYRFCTDRFGLIFGNSADSIFAMYSKLAIDVVSEGSDISDIMGELDAMMEFMNECKEVKEETLGLTFDFDFARVNDIYKAIRAKHESGQAVPEEDGTVQDENLSAFSESQADEAVKATKGSLKKILGYSGIASEKAESFVKFLTAYKGLKDPYSTENDVRKLRSRITELYYEIYENVFFKAEETNENDRIINMFLDFGYMDETMFEKDRLVELYYLRHTKYEGRVSVYTTRQWLHAIYSGEKEPSKNEFDLDYDENFRELKKSQKFTPEEENEYFSDKKGKVHYEIVNMFKSNNRITNGQITKIGRAHV